MKIALLLALCAAPAGAQPSAAEIQAIAERAYVFAYPLVLMEHTRQASLAAGPENRFSHRLQFPDSSDRAVVRPNADTLYSLSWIDLAQEPLALHVPDTQGRYYLMQFLDAWTDTFSVPGKRTTGTKESWFAIVGPGWRGSLPPRLERIESPTNMVWLVGRTQTNGPQDYAAVHEIQKGYLLMPLSQYPNGSTAPPSSPPRTDNRAALPPPIQVARLTAAEFFREFAQLLRQNPPHPDDGPMMRDLARIGIERGKPFEPEALGREGLAAIEAGARAAAHALEPAGPGTAKAGRSGWSNLGAKVGRYGTDYRTRARVARIGLGALPPEDAVYLNCEVDAEGKPLDGSRTYRMHFAKDALPPVQAFWSVAMYDDRGYFVDNPIRRYSIGDRDALHFNGDGSLDLYAGSHAPGEGKDSNWLPAPAGKFNLTFRLYWPQAAALQGTWLPPAVRLER